MVSRTLISTHNNTLHNKFYYVMRIVKNVWPLERSTILAMRSRSERELIFVESFHGLALISIEHEKASSWDYATLIYSFSAVKARKIALAAY